MARVIAAACAGWGRRAGGLLALFILWSGIGETALAASYIDYLYVEANEGDSSGGHAAIRFGDETFHFQHESPGILRIQRHDAAAFHHVYAMLGNRSIHESRIAVSDDTYALLRGAFVRLLLVQDAQVEIRDALHKDVSLLDLLLRHAGDSEARKEGIVVPVSGLGYFLADTPPSAMTTSVGGLGDDKSAALVSLRKRIVAENGELFLAEKAASAMAALRGMEPHAVARPLPEIERDAFASFEATVAMRYEDTLHALFALKVLQASPGLREGAFWAPASETFTLAPHEVVTLKKFAGQLENELAGLLKSQRTDWGYPFILGLARLAAVEATLASGRLVLLDIFGRGEDLPPRHDAALRPYLPMMHREMENIFLQKRLKFFSAGTFREAEYAAMERSGNLLLDLNRAMATGTPLRAVPKSPFPARPATVRAPLPGNTDERTLVRELAAAQAAEREYQDILNAMYGYDLVRRNCVTEIFGVINAAVAKTSAIHQPEREKEASEKLLGGFVDGGHGLTFIPFVSAAMVESSYHVIETRHRPSYRKARLSELERDEGRLSVFLRESNTITSSVYRPGPGDSAFFFFTDDILLLRPLFGVFNLLAGVGESLLGALTLPGEGPGRLVSGVRGVFFSLPELVFVNLRKGTMAYVEPSFDP